VRFLVRLLILTVLEQLLTPHPGKYFLSVEIPSQAVNPPGAKTPHPGKYFLAGEIHSQAVNPPGVGKKGS